MNDLNRNLASSLTLPAIMLGTLLSVGVIGASVILSHGAQQVAAAREKISVKGTAEKSVKADRAQWVTTLTIDAASVAEGLPRLKTATDQVVSNLSADGLIPAKALELSAWSATPLYQRLENGYDGPLTGYRLERQIGIALQDVQKPTQLNQRVEQLIAQGVNVHDSRTDYLVGNLEQIKLSLIGEATKNAHDRAIEFAKSGGVSVGAMQSASQGVFQIRAPLSTDESDYGGEYDTTTIDKIARVVVTVDYAIQN
jgi:hypothetical protein